MFREAYLDIMRFIEMGGDVLWFIALITFIMWTLIFERIWFFRMEYRGMMEELTESWNGRSERNSWTARQIRDGVISDATDRISGTLPIIQTCVALCPLFGLLGTVTGMIAVFDAMAAGVSMATIPTMSGMIASLSGLIASTLIRRKVEQETQLLDSQIALDL